MKFRKGIQFFAVPLPVIMTIYLADNYYISIGSDFDPVFTVGENFIEGDATFEVTSSGTATDIDYTVNGNKITFTKNISGIGYTDFSTVNVAVGGAFSSNSNTSSQNYHKFYVIPSATAQSTLDLSTLALTYGTHTVKVKAKADGYKDSEFSNEVIYIKEPLP